MKINWQSTDFFKEEFVTIGKWDFSKIYKVSKEEYLSADTETKLYYNGKLLTDDESYLLYKLNGQKWCKENIEVRPYAFMISNGDDFALFQNCEDFLTAIAMLNTKIVFWYNAKFDFAILDYYMLTNDWKPVDERIEANENNYRKLPDKTYQSLNGDFGQRYQLRIWKSYKNKYYREKVHNFKNVDICNIFSGGLAKNLEDWKIVDRQGNPVRKLEMDYVNASIEDDIQYMINDTKGLHLLAEKINETMLELTGYSLFNNEYITAGGLAKKTLLKTMFKKEKPYQNIEVFKSFFPMTVEEDKDYRQNALYLGGKCLVNPKKRYKPQSNIYKYDVNSMYPDKMRNMYYPIGKPISVENTDDKSGVYILKISHLYGLMKPNMLPIWQDHLTGDYVEEMNEEEERYIWLEELEELENWYYLDYEIEDILYFQKAKPKGAIEFIDKFYDLKNNTKGAVKNGCKLLLNSSYGKIAQRVERINCHYELTETGYVHLVKDEPEIDEKSMLSVVVGSRITSLSRVHLMELIRKTSKGNPEKNFIYCDTDSVHTLCEYDDCDDKELGKLKNEGVFEKGVYLAPKSYMLYNGEYEVHCKGVNTKVVKKELDQCKTFEEALKIFRPNKTFKCLCGLNVKGGKALLLVDKMIVDDDNYEITIRQPDDDLEDNIGD